MILDFDYLFLLFESVFNFSHSHCTSLIFPLASSSPIPFPSLLSPILSPIHMQTAQGVRFTPGGIRKGAAGYDVCFIHPKGNAEKPIGACGVLVELVQAPPAVIAAMSETA